MDPIRDLDIISQELILKDLDTLQRAQEQLQGLLKKQGGALFKKGQGRGSPVAQALHLLGQEPRHLQALMQECWHALHDEGRELRQLRPGWSPEQWRAVQSLEMLTAKPAVYTVNVGEEEFLSGEEFALFSPFFKQS